MKRVFITTTMANNMWSEVKNLGVIVPKISTLDEVKASNGNLINAIKSDALTEALIEKGLKIEHYKAVTIKLTVGDILFFIDTDVKLFDLDEKNQPLPESTMISVTKYEVTKPIDYIKSILDDKFE